MKRFVLGLLAAGLLLFGYIFIMGAIKGFFHPQPGEGTADWVSPGLLAIPFSVSGLWITWRILQPFGPEWLVRPFIQSLALYLIAVFFMLLIPAFAHAFGFVAFCAFSLAAPFAALRRPRWITTVLSALLSGTGLFGAVLQTGETISGHSLGDATAVYLLPMQGLPALLILSGVVRLFQKKPAAPQVLGQ